MGSPSLAQENRIWGMRDTRIRNEDRGTMGQRIENKGPAPLAALHPPFAVPLSLSPHSQSPPSPIPRSPIPRSPIPPPPVTLVLMPFRRPCRYLPPHLRLSTGPL